MNVLKILMWLFPAFILSQPYQLLGQGNEVKGRVFDKQSHEGLEAVLVHLDSSFAYTNASGYFTFSNINPGDHILSISHLGYESQTHEVRIPSKRHRLHFHLVSKDFKLPAVTLEADFLQGGPKESSLSSEMVDEDFLEKNYQNTLTQTLSKIPGVNSMNTGVGIGKPMIRGLSFNRVIVNIDGIKQEGQQWGQDHGLEVDQFNVSRLEIIKGANSLIYGSDGLGGVINILPAPIPEEGTIDGELLSFFRSNNDNLGLSASLKGNIRNVFFRARYSQQDYADYRVPAETFTYNTFILPIFDQRLKNTAGNERNASFETGIIRGWGSLRLNVSNFRQEAGFFSGALGIPRSYQLSPDGDLRNIDLPRQKINHFKTVLSGQFFPKGQLLETELGFQENRRKEESRPDAHSYRPPTNSVLALGLILRTIRGNIRYLHKHNNSFRTRYGMSVQTQFNQRDGFEFLLPDHQSTNAGLFSLAEYDLRPDLTINGGLRLDYGSAISEAVSTPVYNGNLEIIRMWRRSPDLNRHFFNYSAAAGLSWYPNDHLNLKANFGRTFRLPAMPELTINGMHHGTFRHEQGDSTLNSERGYQLDFSLALRRKSWLFKFSPYFNYFDNYLYLRPIGSFSLLPEAGQIYRYSQNQALHTGFEGLLEYHPIDALHFSTSLEYVWNWNLDSNLPLPFTPPFSSHSQLDYTFLLNAKRFHHLMLSAEYRWTAPQNFTDRNEAATPGYHLVHFQAGFKIRMGVHNLECFVRLDNAFNVNYMNHLSRYRILNLPEQGRNIQVTLRIPFSILKHKE